MIKGRQIPVASECARKIDDLVQEMRAVADKLSKAGLHEDAHEVRKTADLFVCRSVALEGKARETYAAARRGEPIPT